MGKQLPLFIDKTQLPTGKNHISYSEITDFMACGHRHKVKYVDKIILDSGSIHTCYGTALHDAVETYITTRKMPDVKEVVKNFYAQILELDNEEIRQKALDEAKEFVDAIPNILNQLPDWLEETFPGWQIVEAEHYLFESIEKQTNIHFKGYIDAILKVPVKKTKKHPKGYKYVILDWKTSRWGWKADQKRDFNKQMQLIFYKHFWCRFMNIDLDQATCAFVLLKRVPRKADKSFIEMVKVSVGPKAIERALKELNTSINKIKKGFVTKNRYSCEPFCPYLNSKYCL